MSNPAWRPLLEGEENEYAAIIQLAEAERRERGCGLIEVASMEARARWEAARARHHPWGSRARPGLAAGTQEALHDAQHQLIMCLRHECRSLVHLQSARQQARAAGRDALAAGDGCASRLCTLGHVRPQRFARTQEAMATGLLGGSHTLVLPPLAVTARVNLWTVPGPLACRVAHRVLGTGACEMCDA